jgi:integrase/recombinase XerD
MIEITNHSTRLLIESFQSYLTRLGYSKSTQNMLPNILYEFLIFVGKELADISKTDVLRYYDYIKERPKKRGIGLLSESMINHHIYALKTFFAYQMELGQIQINPMSTLSFSAPKSKPREILSQKQIKEVFSYCVTYRERTVLNLCYGLGLRRTEAVKLNLEDINFSTAQAFIREGKANKRRVVPISPKVLKGLKCYLENERLSLGTQAFITTKTGERTTGANLNNTLKIILDRTQIEKKITLHCLRHSIATHLLENGLSLEKVRDFLGHKHLETTQIYTRVNRKQIFSLSGS